MARGAHFLPLQSARAHPVVEEEAGVCRGFPAFPSNAASKYPSESRTGPLLVSIAALCLSIIFIFFTAKTYLLTWRPYVGVVKQACAVTNAPDRLVCRLGIKDLGSSPAYLHVDLVQWEFVEGGTLNRMTDTEPRDNLLIMPGEGRDIAVQIPKSSAKFDSVLAIPVRLNLRLAYSSDGPLFRKTVHHYVAWFELTRASGQPELLTEYVQGD